ncbi:MAG: 2-dehydropantoate 2-reductase [Rhodomicrobium sp.]
MSKELSEHTHIAIYGAGTLGCFVGGLLLLAGRRVTFLARPRISAELAVHGLLLTDFTGLHARVIPEALDVRSRADFLREAGLVLVTVKSGSTEAAADEIASLAGPCVPAVSLQNGVGNPDILRGRLGPDRVLGGMVAFNVVHKGQGHFHRGTSGAIVVEAGRPDILRLLSVPGLKVSPSANIAEVQWGKLLFNLNNGLNALSGLPLRRQLEDRAWRRLLAAQIAEALEIMDAAGIEPVTANKIPSRLIPRLLRLPNALFALAARPMLQIDPEARSSTWEDLMLGRPTEIDRFQGMIVRLAREHGLKAPISEAILRLVKDAEEAGAGPPGLSPQDIARRFPAPAVSRSS